MARERRRIRNPDGRRVGERRALLMEVAPPGGLPGWLRPYAGRVRFVERAEPSERQRENVAANRWVIRFQAGEETAFASLYGHFHDLVRSYVETALGDGDEHEVEDAIQEVFGQVARSLPRYEIRGFPFRVWLMLVARSRVVNYLVKHRRAGVEPMAPAELDHRREGASRQAELDLQRPLDDKAVLKAIQRLAPGQRQVIFLRYMLGFSIEQIAKLLDTTPHAIRNINYRALVILRARLNPTTPNPRQIDRQGWQRRPQQARILRNRRFALWG